MDSTPGKLGAGQGESNPISISLADIEAIDVRFLENNVNKELLPRLREMGMSIPEDLVFKIKNDNERQEARRREDDNNQATATVAQTMKNAGLQMDADYFSERTGIPTTKIVEAAVKENKELENEDEDESKGITNQIKNRLNEIYR
jgi:post-segregation antitoxin (ccd killing protein)